MRSVILEIVRYTSALLPLTAAVLLLAGCSESPPETKPAKATSPYGPGPATSSSKNPLAKFIELANARGGRDNITTILVRVEDAPRTSSSPPR